MRLPCLTNFAVGFALGFFLGLSLGLTRGTDFFRTVRQGLT